MNILFYSLTICYYVTKIFYSWFHYQTAKINDTEFTEGDGEDIVFDTKDYGDVDGDDIDEVCMLSLRHYIIM